MNDGDLGHIIKDYLSDPAMRQAVVEDYAHTFRTIGVSAEVARPLADSVVEILETQPLSDAQNDIFTLFQNTPARARVGGYTNVTGAFDEVLQRRASAFSGQVMLSLQDLPERSTIANISPHHERLEQRGSKYDIVEADEPEGLSGSFQCAVLNNVLHHETPERAQEVLSAMSDSAATRLVVIENTTLGNNPDEQGRDNGLQYMHEYLFHRLLQGPRGDDTPLPGNYDTAEGWAQKVESMGWRLSFRDSFVMEPHHTVMVFEREP